MTEDNYKKATELTHEICSLEGLLEFIESEILEYKYDPSLRYSGSRLSYHGVGLVGFSEASAVTICDTLKARIEDLKNEFAAL